MTYDLMSPTAFRSRTCSSGLTDDIVPFVDRTYLTDPDDRCLFDYSPSGLFVCTR